MFTNDDVLPRLVIDIVDVIGIEATNKLIYERRGVTVSVPKNPKTSSILSSIIGLEKTILMSKVFGGATIAIPSCKTARITALHSEIRARFDSGDSIVNLAQRFVLSDRSIYNLLNCYNKPSGNILEKRDIPERNSYTATIDRLCENDLSVVMKKMCSIIGIEAIKSLMGKRGGTRITIPKVILPRHAIVSIISLEKAQKLSEHFTGVFYVPNCQSGRLRARNSAIRSDYKMGISTANLVKKYNLGRKHIYTVLNS